MKQNTIKDIARMCNVSVSTVSRVLNNHQDVSDSVRKHILEVIEQSGYIPNNSARNLVCTSSDTIALVVRGVSNPFFTRVIKGVEQEIHRRGYSVALHQISSCDDEIKTACSLATERKLLGILLLGGRFNYSPQDTTRLNVPFVCCSYTNTFGTLDTASYSSVAVDDKKEAYNAVKYLAACGHKRIAALIEQESDTSISELRFSGYKQALLDCGLTYDEALVECTGSFNMEDSYHGMQRLLNKGVEFSAVFTIADAMAIAAIKAITDHGLSVPKDCSVIAIDGLELSKYTVPTLTTLEQPADEMAKESADILIDLIEEKGSNRHVVLTTTLREGGSVQNITVS